MPCSVKARWLERPTAAVSRFFAAEKVANLAAAPVPLMMALPCAGRRSAEKAAGGCCAPSGSPKKQPSHHKPATGLARAREAASKGPGRVKSPPIQGASTAWVFICRFYFAAGNFVSLARSTRIIRIISQLQLIVFSPRTFG